MKKELERTSVIASLLCNLLIIVCTAISLSGFFTAGGSGNMAVIGRKAFVYFTVDSNILCALSSAVILVYSIRSLISGTEFVLPVWAMLFKFTGTIAVAVTFFTVMFFLGPVMGYGAMLDGNNLFMHLTSPVFALLSFILFEYNPVLTKKNSLFGILPTLVYGAIYFYMVIILGVENGGWVDFYGFNMTGMWYLSIIGMLLGTYLIIIAVKAAGKAYHRASK